MTPCCVLEQDTLSYAYYCLIQAQPRKTGRLWVISGQGTKILSLSMDSFADHIIMSHIYKVDSLR